MRAQAGSLREQWGPRGAYLDLGTRRLRRHSSERVAGHRRHGAARRVVFSAVAIERIDQPGPTHTWKQRIGHHLRIDIGAREGDATKRTLPCRIACRVMQQHESTATQLLAADDNVSRNRSRIRRYPLRGRKLLDMQLRAP